MAEQREMSEYGQEEATYRAKSTRAKHCELLLDIFGGLLKALPPVAITNLAVILALSQWLSGATAAEDISGIQRLYDIAVITLSFFFMAVIVAVLVVWRLPPVLVTNQRYAEWSDVKVRAIKTDALAALGDYDGDMPRIQLSAMRQAQLDDLGKMNAQWIRPNWRILPKVPEKMQRNLEDLYPDLVKKMDELPAMVVEYCEAFDAYSEAFQKAYNTTWGKKDSMKLQVVDNHARGRIIGSYFWFSGEIQNLPELEGEKSVIVADDVTSRFLQEFLKGDPLESNSVSSMQSRSDLKELARKARKVWEDAHYKWMEIRGIVIEVRQRAV